jgi:hypothetical protein
MTDNRPDVDDDVSPESYADLAALAKSLTDEDARLEAPPADLWSRIEAQITITHVPATDAPVATTSAPQAPVIDELAARRARRRVRWLAGAAAAVVAIAAIAGIALATDDDGDGGTDVADIALDNAEVNAGLDPRGAGSTGEAHLVQLDDGRYALDIDVEGLPAEDGDFYELWVIDTDVVGMVSLGPLHGSGRYPLPESVDPRAFPVVDISIEPADGVPTHSGASVLRGVLDT